MNNDIQKRLVKKLNSKNININDTSRDIVSMSPTTTPDIDNNIIPLQNGDINNYYLLEKAMTNNNNLALLFFGVSIFALYIILKIAKSNDKDK